MEPANDTKKPLVFSLKLPTLKELSLMRVARAVWASKAIISELQRVSRTFGEPERRYYQPVEKRANCQTSLLPLPPSLIKEVTPLIHHFGRVLYRWIEPFERKGTAMATFKDWPARIYLDYVVNDKLRWTVNGTVDHLQTAKFILRDETIPTKDRFEVACNLCMEEEVRRLWQERLQDDFFDKTFCLADYWSAKIQQITRDHSNDIEAPNSLPFHSFDYESLFSDFYYVGHFSQFHNPYFWPKLTDPQRERYLVTFIENSAVWPLPNDNFFLLNKLDFEQQREVLGADAWEFLRQFLSRPWQHLFFPTFNAVKDQLGAHGCATFLRRANLDQCDDSFRYQFYSEVGPLMRQYIAGRRESSTILAYQVWAGNAAFVKEVMRDQPVSRKLDLILKGFKWPKEEISEIYIKKAFHRSVEILETLKELIEEWVNQEEWPDLKCKINTVLAKNELWADCGNDLDTFFQSLDQQFYNCSLYVQVLPK